MFDNLERMEKNRMTKVFITVGWKEGVGVVQGIIGGAEWRQF